MIKALLPDDQNREKSDLKTGLTKIFKDIDITAYSDENALHEMVSTLNPDIVFVHFKQARQNNFNLINELKKNQEFKNLPVAVLVNAEHNDKQKSIALKERVDFFVKLPPDEIELEAFMKLLLKEKESKDQFELIFSSSNDFVFLHQFDKEKGAGKIIRASDAVCRRLGYSIEELRTFRPVDLTTDSDLIITQESKILAEKGKLRFEKTIVTKSGEKIPVEFESRVVESNGKLIAVAIGRDISERKKSEELIRKSEDKFHKIFDSSPVPQFSWSYNEKQFTLVGVNNAANRLTNNLAKDFIGMTADEIYPDRPDILERFHFCLDKRRNIVFETDYIARGTKLQRHIIFKYTYVTDDLLLLHTEDITERKQAEEKLIESEQKYRALITGMEQGLAVYEPVYNENGKMTDYRIIDFNQSFEKQAGLKKDEAIGKTVLNVFPNAKSYWIEEYEKVVKTGNPVHHENYIADSGRYFDVVAYRNQKNQFATVTTDITERKKNLKSLSVHNARLEALTKILKYESDDLEKLLTFALEQATNLTESEMGFLWFYDSQLKKITLHACSEGARKKYGLENNPTTYDLGDAGFWGEAVRQRKPFLMNDYSAPNKYERGVPEGHIQFKKFLTVPVLVNSEIKAVVGVANKEDDYGEDDIKQLTLLTDTLWTIVERKEQHRELILAKEKAEESDKLKSAFLANMSHEIRTPMNGILGFTDMLKEENVSSDELGNYVEIIEKSGKRMLNTIDDLMDISRIESKLVEVSQAEVNVNEIIDTLYTFFRPEAESRGLELKTVKPLPDENAVIETDRDKFYAVLMNLIKNALKYTDYGSIEFGYETKKDALQFFVKDTGIGIEKDKLEAIFERFVQADNSLAKPYEGVGLGLSIAKAYTDLIGGKIWVESEKDKGSVFFMEVPFGGEIIIAESKMPDQKKERPVKEKKTTLENLNVLVAEDDEVGRLYLQQLLEGKCKKIFYANNGKEAVKIYADNAGIDLILMDIKMPIMDGYSATIKIRSMDHDAIIIAQTAYALSGDREKAIAAGCDEYLTKPLSKENLLSAIQKYF